MLKQSIINTRSLQNFDFFYSKDTTSHHVSFDYVYKLSIPVASRHCWPAHF